MKARTITKLFAVLSVFWAVLPATTGSAQAAALNLTVTYPDFVLSGLDVNYAYNSGTSTGVLTVGRVENNGASGGNNDWMCDANETCIGNANASKYATSSTPPSYQVTNYADTDDPTYGATGTNPYLRNFSLYAQLAISGTGSSANGTVAQGWFQLDGVVRTFTGVPPGSTGCPGYVSTTYMCVLAYNNGAYNTTGTGTLLDGTLDPTGGLLSGSLAQFGWVGTSATGGMLEFTFNNADGVIQTMIGGSGGGMKIYPVSANTTSFGTQALTQSWSSVGATADVFVPIPAAVWLFGSGVLALLGVARRKSKH